MSVAPDDEKCVKFADLLSNIPLVTLVYVKNTTKLYTALKMFNKNSTKICTALKMSNKNH
jgi:hypothetical protein